MQASQRCNSVHRQLLSQDRLAVRTELQGFLVSHDAALVNQCRRRNEIVLGLVDAPLKGEVPENRDIADDGVEVAGPLTPLGLLEVIVGEFGNGREHPDHVLRACVDMLDMVLVNPLHLFRDEPSDLVLAH